MTFKVKQFKQAAALFLLVGAPAFSAGDHGPGNGGDVVCEKRAYEIRDDIAVWIAKGGPVLRGLQVPAPRSVADYMKEIPKTLAAVVVCGDKTKFADLDANPDLDPNFRDALKQLAQLKTCINYVDRAQKQHIRCDWAQFNGTAPEKQYELMHHEYAGLAGFETNKGGVPSDYQITRQITGYLETTLVKKLAIVPGAVAKPHDIPVDKLQIRYLVHRLGGASTEKEARSFIYNMRGHSDNFFYYEQFLMGRVIVSLERHANGEWTLGVVGLKKD